MEKFFSIVSKLILILPIITFLSGWVYPEPGVNYPSQHSNSARNRAHNYMDSERCTQSKTVNCIGISNTHPGVIVYVYPWGENLNPHFISSYALNLRRDCDSQLGSQEACNYYNTQMTYLNAAKISPRSQFDIWPVSGIMGDAMVQAQIAQLYLKDGEFHKMNRAGVAFDWSWSSGGLAHAYNSNEYWYMSAGANETKRRNSLNVHNRALSIIHDMIATMKRSDVVVPNEQAVVAQWQRRLDRGVASLISRVHTFDCGPSCSNGVAWSYARTLPSKVEGSDGAGGYHELNYKTLQRLINKDLDQSDYLLGYCDRWKFKQYFGSFCNRYGEPPY